MTVTAGTAWELAALATEPVLAASQLIRPPRVEVRGDRLVWWLMSGQSMGHEVAAPADLLLKFARLANAQPNRIRDYAAEWGTLCICEHDLPASHNPSPPFLGGYNGPEYWCSWLGRHDRQGEGDGWEPLAAWHRFAGQACALLSIAAALHRGRLGEEKDWRRVYAQSGREAPWWKRRADAAGLAGERWLLSNVVNEWLAIGDVRPALVWGAFTEGRTNARVTLQGSGLFGALAVQLLMAVSRTEGLAVCSNCGTPYAPTRRPRADRRNYCPDCGLRAAWRDAQRARRRPKARKKAPHGKATLPG